jgi:hypothetical protein
MKAIVYHDIIFQRADLSRVCNLYRHQQFHFGRHWELPMASPPEWPGEDGDPSEWGRATHVGLVRGSGMSPNPHLSILGHRRRHSPHGIADVVGHE